MKNIYLNFQDICVQARNMGFYGAKETVWI